MLLKIPPTEPICLATLILPTRNIILSSTCSTPHQLEKKEDASAEDLQEFLQGHQPGIQLQYQVCYYYLLLWDKSLDPSPKHPPFNSFIY